jgi:hypothetical protein
MAVQIRNKRFAENGEDVVVSGRPEAGVFAEAREWLNGIIQRVPILTGADSSEFNGGINVEEHRVRCSGSQYKGWPYYRVLAWVGDVTLEADVRMGLVMSDISMTEVDSYKQRIVGNKNLADYWRSLSNLERSRLIRGNGTNDKAFADFFEANYRKEFRLIFLTHTFGQEIARFLVRTVPDWYVDALDDPGPSTSMSFY